MRIISGTHKGRKITAPKKLPVRPTTDMAKESLFNILGNHFYFDAVSVLDLFAGTGNISYEFASRGTTQITCVDQDFGCIRFINQTAQQYGMPIQTIKSDVFKYLEKTKLQTNIVFADPPYNFSDADFAKIPELVFKNQLLAKGGLLIVEHSKHTNLSKHQHFGYSKTYGGSTFSFFENNPE
ncbi:MAG: RsmD family RNA methyltransferase [Flavobacteriaceae bacterium]